ncbi:hypothetical protein DAI22_07g088300 [Oryza sativa Japonica Group]|nr:hypothetical protein DAI22_07g088300 [Oryza sativa Japonica Group]
MAGSPRSRLRPCRRGCLWSGLVSQKLEAGSLGLVVPLRSDPIAVGNCGNESDGLNWPGPYHVPPLPPPCFLASGSPGNHRSPSCISCQTAGERVATKNGVLGWAAGAKIRVLLCLYRQREAGLHRGNGALALHLHGGGGFFLPLRCIGARRESTLVKLRQVLIARTVVCGFYCSNSNKQ